MIRSGIAPLDERLGGLQSGDAFLITGGPGTGKTTMCLQFANAGLQRGDAVCMVIVGRGSSLKSHAAYLGIDLARALRSRRLVLLRYRSDFVARLAHALTPERVIQDLRRLTQPLHLRRIVLDSFAPFLGESSFTGAGVAALAATLEHEQANAMLTYPEELRGGYDRRLEPIVQLAAGVIRLSREEDETRRLELLTLRAAPHRAGSARFAISAGRGIIAAPDAGDARVPGGVAAGLDSRLLRS